MVFLTYKMEILNPLKHKKNERDLFNLKKYILIYYRFKSIFI